MTRAVLINEKRNDIHEIDIDISPNKNEIYKLLCPREMTWMCLSYHPYSKCCLPINKH